MGHSPDYVILAVAATSGLVGTGRYHFDTALAMGVPVFVVVTKTDVCTQQQLTRTLTQVSSALKPSARTTLFVQSEADAEMAAASDLARVVAPIFMVSSVTGQNLRLLRAFLNLLPTQEAKYQALAHEPAEFQVGQVHRVHGAGTVASGIVLKGTVRAGDELLLGPDPAGAFRRVEVGSIHCNRAPFQHATAGCSASFALREVAADEVRAGQMLLGHGATPRVCSAFEASVTFVTPRTAGSRPPPDATVYVGGARQLATVAAAAAGAVGAVGQQAAAARGEAGLPLVQLLHFTFTRQPEHVNVGAHFLFRNGSCTGVGRITKLLAPHSPSARAPAEPRAASADGTGATGSLVQ